MKSVFDFAKLIGRSFRLVHSQRAWRTKNPHNRTVVANFFPHDLVTVGNFSYGPLTVWSFGAEAEALKIGHFCSIGGEVHFLTGGGHQMDTPSTFPIRQMIFAGTRAEALSKGQITLNDDVWIGHRCTILSGVTIGQGAVVAAGTVVRKSIPPYAIIGNSGLIRYRFTPEISSILEKVDYSCLTRRFVEENFGLFSEPATVNSASRLLQLVQQERKS